MARISPFRALRFNPRKAPLSKVVCPPYDIINREERKRYAGLSRHNIVRVVLPARRKKRRDYASAKRVFYGWIDKGVLRRDEAPSIYVYKQEYKTGGRRISRYGILALLALGGKRNSTALPHERIFQSPMLDRLRLMEALRAHLSPIFLISRDKKAIISRFLQDKADGLRPDINIAFGGVRHRLWRVTDERFIKTLLAHLERRKIFIADGHHRFEASKALSVRLTSLDRKKIGATEGPSHTLVYIVSSKDRGLLIMPTYRAVKILPDGFSSEFMVNELKRYFAVKPLPARRIRHELQKAAKRRECAFGIYYKSRFLFLLLKDKSAIDNIGSGKGGYHWRRLDVSILHNLIFAKLLGIKEKVLSHRNIYYYKDARELIRSVKSGEHQLGVLLNPPTIEEVEKIAEAGEKMPHKSTYFYPKPLTGLVIHKF